MLNKITKEQLVKALWNEYDAEYGFMKKEDGRLMWNPIALMLWGAILAKDGNEHKLIKE